MDDPKKLADEKKAYLSAWLNNAKSITDAIPKVQQQLDLASWEAVALSDAPGELISPFSSNLSNLFLQDIGIIKSSLPNLPKIDLKYLNVSSASTAATASDVFAITDQARYSDKPQICDWGNRHSTEYLLLQNQLKRDEEVKVLLVKLKPSLGLEFENASNEVLKCIANTGNQTSAGIAMRNLLEHYKGELFNLARQSMREQKLKWSEIADRLVSPGTPCDRFKAQEGKWDSIQQRLSRLAKGHITMNNSELKNIFAELIDHIYITLSLVPQP